MKTSSWHRAGAIAGRVGICRGSPRGAAAGYRMYRRIAPTREMLALPPGEFEPAYQELLDQLDAAEIWREIHELVGPGVEPIALCFEERRCDCHRAQFSAWLQRELGVEVPELEPVGQLI